VKRCPKCKETKETEEFYKGRRECRVCFRALSASRMATLPGKANLLRSGYGYSPEDSLAVAAMLYDMECRCAICGMPAWLVALNHKKGGPFFLGTTHQNARMHHDRIDTTQPHSLANVRILCPSCNIKRGAERHTDVEVLRWVRRQWEAIFSPRFLWWMNTEPGRGGRSRRNPGRTDGPERGLAT